MAIPLAAPVVGPPSSQRRSQPPPKPKQPSAEPQLLSPSERPIIAALILDIQGISEPAPPRSEEPSPLSFEEESLSQALDRSTPPGSFPSVGLGEAAATGEGASAALDQPALDQPALGRDSDEPARYSQEEPLVEVEIDVAEPGALPPPPTLPRLAAPGDTGALQGSFDDRADQGGDVTLEIDDDDVALAEEPHSDEPPAPISAEPLSERDEVITVEIPVDEVLAQTAPPAAGPPPPPPPRRRSQPPPPSAVAKALADTGTAPATSPKRRAWWEELFTDDFARTSPEDGERWVGAEVDFIEGCLGLRPGARVLDVGCGRGEVAVELSARDYDIVGLDLSEAQLAAAEEHSLLHSKQIKFLLQDMRSMSFEDEFDAVYCWNTSFGYFEEEKNLQVMRDIFRALRPGGTFLLDVANRDYAVATEPCQNWFEGDGCICMDDMSIDFITSRMRVKRTMILDDGRSLESSYSIRVYSLHELGRLMHEVGFRVTQASGDSKLPGVFFGAVSPRIIIVATKP